MATTTYNVTFTPFNNSTSIPGTINLTPNTSSTAEVAISVNGAPAVTLNGTISSCSKAAQIITTSPNVKFAEVELVQPSQPALQVGLVGFYVSTVSGLGGAGTFAGIAG